MVAFIYILLSGQPQVWPLSVVVYSWCSLVQNKISDLYKDLNEVYATAAKQQVTSVTTNQ